MANTIEETRSQPICFWCKNYIINDDKKTFICKAFKNGIPDIILNSENDHSKPLPKQKNDIVFEQIK